MSPANLKVCVVRTLALYVALTATTAANAQFNFIQSVNSSLYLDADPGQQGNGARVYMWEFNGSPWQKWRLKDAGDGLYFIQSVNSSLYLDADPGQQGNGARIYRWEFNGSPWQKWRLNPTN